MSAADDDTLALYEAPARCGSIVLAIEIPVKDVLLGLRRTLT